MSKSTYNQSMRWIWMMSYCKQQGIPPAQEFAWNKANRAFECHVTNQPTGQNITGVIIDEIPN